MNSKIKSYCKLMRLNKPIGSVLLLWPTLWALWVAAEGWPNRRVLVVFLLGVVVMRSAGCVINDIADRNFDGAVARTKHRPLVTGAVTLKGALVLFLFLSMVGFFLVLQLNTYTIVLSFVGIFLAVLYPFSKRITYFPQVLLGAAYAWPVPMAFAAQLNTIPPVGWLLYGIAVLWPIAYDSIYALMDKEDDIKIGIKSTVIFFGQYDILLIFIMQMMVLFGLTLLGWLLHLNLYYYVALFVATAMVYHQYNLISICKDYYHAFTNNQWVGLIIFLGFAANYL